MTAPTPADLDKAVIDAGVALLDALTADPLDQQAVDDATAALEAARTARGYV